MFSQNFKYQRKTSEKREQCTFKWMECHVYFSENAVQCICISEAQEDCMNKLIWIAYLIGCNYVLPKSQLFKSFILWKYGNCLLSHVVNYEFQEELSWLKLFIVFFFFVSMVALTIELSCFDFVSEWHFFPQRIDFIWGPEILDIFHQLLIQESYFLQMNLKVCREEKWSLF